MEENKSSIGSIIGIIIIIAIIVLGGLYFWGKRIEENKAKEDLISNFAPGTADSATNTSSASSTSDSLDSIEADLNTTNLNDLSPELNPQLQ